MSRATGGSSRLLAAGSDRLSDGAGGRALMCWFWETVTLARCMLLFGILHSCSWKLSSSTCCVSVETWRSAAATATKQEPDHQQPISSQQSCGRWLLRFGRLSTRQRLPAEVCAATMPQSLCADAPCTACGPSTRARCSCAACSGVWPSPALCTQHTTNWPRPHQQQRQPAQPTWLMRPATCARSCSFSCSSCVVCCCRLSLLRAALSLFLIMRSSALATLSPPRCPGLFLPLVLRCRTDRTAGSKAAAAAWQQQRLHCVAQHSVTACMA